MGWLLYVLVGSCRLMLLLGFCGHEFPKKTGGSRLNASICNVSDSRRRPRRRRSSRSNSTHVSGLFLAQGTPSVEFSFFDVFRFEGCSTIRILRTRMILVKHLRVCR